MAPPRRCPSRGSSSQRLFLSASFRSPVELFGLVNDRRSALVPVFSFCIHFLESILLASIRVDNNLSIIQVLIFLKLSLQLWCLPTAEC
jgi:hypothetical protein